MIHRRQPAADAIMYVTCWLIQSCCEAAVCPFSFVQDGGGELSESELSEIFQRLGRKPAPGELAEVRSEAVDLNCETVRLLTNERGAAMLPSVAASSAMLPSVATFRL
jgi:hypothetical protein